jgi:hypothetical protein
MHPYIPGSPNPLQVADHADRLARERGGSKLGLVFSAVTAISLGVMTTKMLLDIVHENRYRESKHGRGR